MAAELTAAINQSYFDFYFFTCLRYFNATDWDNLEGTKNILKSALIKCIDVNYGQNEVKAQILLIIDSMEELLTSCLSQDENPENQEREEILETLEEMQLSLNVLHKYFETNGELTESIRKSLFYNYVVTLQIWIHSRNNSDRPFNEAVPNTLKKMKTVVKMKDHLEKKTLALFEIIFKKNAEPVRKLGYPQMLCDAVRELMSHLSSKLEPPDIFEIYEKHFKEKNKNNSESQGLLDEVPSPTRFYTVEDVDKFLLCRGADPNINDEALKTKAEKIKAEVRVRLEQQKNQERRNVKSSVNEESEELHKITESVVHNRNNDAKRPMKSILPKRSLLDFRRSRKPPSHDRGLRGKWTVEEEDKFIRKTLEIGEGHWLQIKTCLKSLRSTMQLKDKWRNIPEGRKIAVQKELDSSCGL